MQKKHTQSINHSSNSTFSAVVLTPELSALAFGNMNICSGHICEQNVAVAVSMNKKICGSDIHEQPFAMT
jgi:hypothetical protein